MIALSLLWSGLALANADTAAEPTRFVDQLEVGVGPAADATLLHDTGIGLLGALVHAAWVPRPARQLDLRLWGYGFDAEPGAIQLVYHRRVGLSATGRLNVLAGGTRPVAFFGAGADLGYSDYQYSFYASYGGNVSGQGSSGTLGGHGMLGFRVAQEPHFFVDLDVKVRAIWAHRDITPWGATLALVGGWRARR